MTNLVPTERIEKAILLIRCQKVLIDSDIADLYGVTTKRLNEQVRRNPKRFPPDFMFQLNQEEYEALRSHFATIDSGRGKHRKYLPLVFTEQGIAMLSSVLNSDRAIEVNIEIMRAFVRLREWLLTNKTLAHRLNELEKKYNYQFKIVFETIDQIMAAPEPNIRKIGFVRE